MITKIILAIIQFLDDTFKNIRCYSRCCQNSECSCSNVEVQQEEDMIEDVSMSRHTTPDIHHRHHQNQQQENEEINI